MPSSKYKVSDKDVLSLAKVIDELTAKSRRYCSNKDVRVSCRNCKYNLDSICCSSVYLAEQLLEIYRGK